MTTRSKLEKLQELTISEWQILLQSMLLLPIIALALKLKGFKWTQAWLSKHTQETSKQSDPEDKQLNMAQNVARMVSVAANHGFYRSNCLKKSLATWWLLERRGIATELKIGVNKDERGFTAHAWVDFRDIVLNDSIDVRERYSVINDSQIFNEPK